LVIVNGATNALFASVLDRALELRGRRRGIAERQMRDRDQIPARIAAEVRDPAVVGVAVGGGDFRVEALGLPHQAERRVKDRFGHPFAIEQLKPLLHVHRAEGRPRHVGVARTGHQVAQLLGAQLAAHRALAHPRHIRHLLAHPAQRREPAAAAQPRNLAVDLEILVTLLPGDDADRALAILRFEVALPQIGRFENVTVGVDDHRFGRHMLLLVAFRRSPPD
jgi:hypothetical protein